MNKFLLKNKNRQATIEPVVSTKIGQPINTVRSGPNRTLRINQSKNSMSVGSNKTLKINQPKNTIDTSVSPDISTSKLTTNLSENYKKNSFNLNNSNGFNFIADLENISSSNIHSPYVSFNTVNPTGTFNSSLELNNKLSSIGFYMNQSNNGNNHSTFFSVKEKNNNCDESTLDSACLTFKDKNGIYGIYGKDGILINNNNTSINLTGNSITFKDSNSNIASISQLNNQIIFNGNAHIDTGSKNIDESYVTSIISFTTPYPNDYIPQVFLQQYNNNNITPQNLLVTNVTNINFTWKAEINNVGTIMWLAF